MLPVKAHLDSSIEFTSKAGRVLYRSSAYIDVGGGRTIEGVVFGSAPWDADEAVVTLSRYERLLASTGATVYTFRAWHG